MGVRGSSSGHICSPVHTPQSPGTPSPDANYAGGTESSQSWVWAEQGWSAEVGKKETDVPLHLATTFLPYDGWHSSFMRADTRHVFHFSMRQGEGPLWWGVLTRLVSPAWAPDTMPEASLHRQSAETVWATKSLAPDRSTGSQPQHLTSSVTSQCSDRSPLVLTPPSLTFVLCGHRTL